MEKRELSILISAALLPFSAAVDASCGHGHVFASGWGFTEDSAREDAMINACSACDAVYGESCGQTRSSGYTDGWIYDTAWVAVDCGDACS
jgi:hypothetical protein